MVSYGFIHKISFHELVNELAIQFTVERETDGKLPFLDTCVQRTTDGKLEAVVYRKPTHTDKYINASPLP